MPAPIWSAARQRRCGLHHPQARNHSAAGAAHSTSALVIWYSIWFATGAHAATQTITTTYTYNADGAPTAVTTQIGAQPGTTRYFSWDNFLPDAAAPATGTVSAADGNLLDVGPEPGGAGRFGYDVRDRLISCIADGESAASIAYHPASLMASSTLASNDALRFYYDNTATPRMVNTVQSSSGATAGFLGPVRYLGDGSEQVLLNPRKDVRGVYDAAAQTLSAYDYDPYGASTSSATTSLGADRWSLDQDERPATSDQRQDLARNPFQYAGEYRDPVCDAYYLRARWYLPEQQSFLSRDRGDLLHRYGYTAGNPVGRVDPTGLRFTGMDFSRDVGLMIHKLTPGVAAYIEPVLPIWGQVLGGIELVGLLPTFWHHPTALKITELGLIGASVATEVAGEFGWFDRLGTPARALGAHIATDTVLGGTQTAAQSYRHGHLDVPALAQGIEIVASGIFWGRIARGIAYRATNPSADDLDALIGEDSANDGALDRTLVVRARAGAGAAFTAPRMEELDFGLYHEAVLAYGHESVWFGDAELTDDDVWEATWSRDAGDPTRPSRYLESRAARQLSLGGRGRLDAVDGLFQNALDNQRSPLLSRSAVASSDDDAFSNSCRRNAARVRDGVAAFARARRGAIDEGY